MNQEKKRQLTKSEIDKASNERRGIKNKAFKLHVDDIEMIKELAKSLNMPENKLIVEAVKAF